MILGITLTGLLGLAAQCNKGGQPEKTPTEPDPDAKSSVTLWLTKADQSVLLKEREGLVVPVTGSNSHPTITVTEDSKYQTVDGFGYTLTGGSAQLIQALPEAKRDALLNELFGADGIRISYLRLSMGASDLDATVFSYNDLPAGQTDPDQTHFSIDKDRTHLIPVLKKILAIHPNMPIIATPWSPPVWMKDNGSSIGGSLKPAYYDSYAQYFVRYILAMKAEGIAITAITPQNEPLHPGNNPSLLMTAEQQRDFIKNSLGPAFKTAQLATKIIIYDHNLDRPDYPQTILSDPEAAQYVDGAAFHLYAGDIKVMSTVHDAYPEKHLYFTEQWTGAKGSFEGDLLWHVKNVVIGSMRNWSKIALEWNLASDPQYQPHTPGGCTECKGALTINGEAVSRNVGYYIIAHASQFVPPGSVRIPSNELPGIASVAFRTPSGQKVLLLANEHATATTFNLKHQALGELVSLPGKSVATLIWD